MSRFCEWLNVRDKRFLSEQVDQNSFIRIINETFLNNKDLILALCEADDTGAKAAAAEQIVQEKNPGMLAKLRKSGAYTKAGLIALALALGYDLSVPYGLKIPMHKATNTAIELMGGQGHDFSGVGTWASSKPGKDFAKQIDNAAKMKKAREAGERKSTLDQGMYKLRNFGPPSLPPGVAG
jgi:hypothetical protein